MDHEGQIRFVIAHAERRGGHQRLDAVVPQSLLQGDPPLGIDVTGIGRDRQTACPEPIGDLMGVTHRQGVDDAVTGQGRELRRQPGQPFGLIGETDGLQGQGWTVQIAANDLQRRSQHGLEIGHHTIVRGRCRRQQAQIRRQATHHALQQAIVRTEIVPPIRDTVGFIDHEQRNPGCDRSQHLGAEMGVGEAFRRHEQDIDLIAQEARLDVGVIVGIVGVHRLGAQPHAAGGLKLVAHQGEQGRDQECRAAARFAQQFGGDEIDETLAPAGFLHHQ